MDEQVAEQDWSDNPYLYDISGPKRQIQYNKLDKDEMAGDYDNDHYESYNGGNNA